MHGRRIALLLAGVLLLGGCRGGSPRQESPAPLQTTTTAPLPASDTAAGELRGVWISYLDLDTQLQGTDPALARQRLEYILDTCVAQGMNTVFFHVRSHSDAWYASGIFPPAATAAPLLAAGFDPLACAVEAAHARGLAIHAWINPYRIGVTEDNAVGAAGDRFCQDGVWYYNPAADAVRRTVLDGVREILQGYAVDGIHYDDYFYPAGLPAEAMAGETVPDGMTVADSRRTAVNALVSATCSLARQAGKLFGISPAATVDKDYTSAYADVALWLRQPGYADYLCPQIYFGFENTTHGFDAVLARWTALPRDASVRLYAGLALYKAGLADDPYAGDGRGEWAAHSDILARQVRALRSGGQTGGFVLFRWEGLTLSSAATELAALKQEL